MILMQGKDLSKSFGTDLIFENIVFTIKEGEKLALVGPNGAGKTTLFKCLIGEEEIDSGEIMFSNRYSLGYLEQIPDYPEKTTVLDAVMEMYQDIFDLRKEIRKLEERMSREKNPDLLSEIMEDYAKKTAEYEDSGGFSCEADARRIIKGLGFSDADFQKEINYFSGGEKTKVSLARLLAREPDLLLLDEPTNHLDIKALEWLESYLKSYRGSVLLISHDRYFLDNVVSRVLELNNKKINSYPGNYSKYLILKAEEILSYDRQYEKQQKEIAKAEEFIRKYKAGVKSKQARGREKQLNRLELLDKREDERNIHLDFLDIPDSGEIVLQVENLKMGFADRILFQNVSFEIRKKEKVGLIGDNGVGKSTILKIINEEIRALEGKFKIGARVKVGYFAQEHEDLNFNKTIMEEICDEFEFNEKEARKKLASILFFADDCLKQIRDLSGGEQGRLSFLKLILRKPNFLILDEPTNHLDLESKEIIENILIDFPGTILVVSHDRYFLDRVVDRIIDLDKQELRNYLGNYSYFKDKKKELAEMKKDKEEGQKKVIPNKKPKVNKFNQLKVKKKVAELEEEIHSLEDKISFLSEKMSDPEMYQDEKKSIEVVNEFNEAEKNLSLKLEEWERQIILLEE